MVNLLEDKMHSGVLAAYMPYCKYTSKQVAVQCLSERVKPFVCTNMTVTQNGFALAVATAHAVSEQQDRTHLPNFFHSRVYLFLGHTYEAIIEATFGC